MRMGFEKDINKAVVRLGGLFEGFVMCTSKDNDDIFICDERNEMMADEGRVNTGEAICVPLTTNTLVALEAQGDGRGDELPEHLVKAILSEAQDLAETLDEDHPAQDKFVELAESLHRRTLGIDR